MPNNLNIYLHLSNFNVLPTIVTYTRPFVLFSNLVLHHRILLLFGYLSFSLYLFLSVYLYYFCVVKIVFKFRGFTPTIKKKVERERMVFYVYANSLSYSFPMWNDFPFLYFLKNRSLSVRYIFIQSASLSTSI